MAEIGRQGFSIKPDEAIENGEFYNTSSSGEYSGTRTRQALGAELFLPLAKPLNLTLSDVMTVMLCQITVLIS